MNKHLIDPYLEKYHVTVTDENNTLIVDTIIETVGGKKDAISQASKLVKQQSEVSIKAKKIN